VWWVFTTSTVIWQCLLKDGLQERLTETVLFWLLSNRSTVSRGRVICDEVCNSDDCCDIDCCQLEESSKKEHAELEKLSDERTELQNKIEALATGNCVCLVLDVLASSTSRATFSKLLRKILGRFLILGQSLTISGETLTRNNFAVLSNNLS